MNVAHPTWMVQAISMAIYVQVIGSFVWLFVVVLLERGRRGERRRLATVEAELARHMRMTSKSFDATATAIEAIGQTLTLRQENAELREEIKGLDEHEQTDPAFRLPSGIDNPRPESPAIDDEPASSVAHGHWQCVGCRRTYALCEGHYGKKCFGCGGSLELVSYDKPRQGVQLPLPVEPARE